jgi:hypothetical protein
MINPTLLIFFALFSCQQNKIKSETMTKPVIQNLEGNYTGIHNQKEIYISLKAVSGTNKINGVLTMDGKEAKIEATGNDTSCTGVIVEDDTQKSYKITAELINTKLHFNITFPEYNNQILALILDRSTILLNEDGNNISINSDGGTIITSGESSGSSSKELNRDQAMVGKWRFTEVLSSGTGEFYASFSTDYFIRINSNGTLSTWIGKSGGGTNTVIVEGAYGSDYNEYGWYTNGKNFYFVDINTQKAEDPVSYYVEPNRMMFSKGANKRVYQRVD